MVSSSKSQWYKAPISWYTRLSSMLYKTNTLNAKMPSPTVKMSFLHVWIFPKVSTEDHLLYRYFHWVNSYCKFLFGVILQIVRIVTLMLIKFEARHLYFRRYGINMTMQCMFWEEDGALIEFNCRQQVDSHARHPKFCIFYFSYLVLVPVNSSALKPLSYSMRGLIIGCANGSAAIFLLVGYGISEPLTRYLINWGMGAISCGFWYLLLIY